MRIGATRKPSKLQNHVNLYDPNRLVLGTAQLGMPYGIANKKGGPPDPVLAMEIIHAAWRMGIRQIDTAQGYGNSESIIGRALRHFNIASQIKVITKLHPKLDLLNKREIVESVQKSMECLGISKLHGLMLHREQFLDFWGRGLKETFLELIKKSFVEHVGVSVYSPDRAIEALESEGIDLVQVPTSIIDRRFFSEQVFERAAKKKKQIYIRSIFLQGLVLMDIDNIPKQLAALKPTMQTVKELGKRYDRSCLDIAVGYVRHAAPDSHIVFGVEDVAQLDDINSSWLKPLPDGFSEIIATELPLYEGHLLNPSLWFSPAQSL